MDISVYKDFPNFYSEDTRLILNQIGYTKKGPKFFTVIRPRNLKYNVIMLRQERSVNTTKVVYTGDLIPVYGGDIEEGFYGDFSHVKENGIYRIQIGDTLSEKIVISDSSYISTLRIIYNYYQNQRCGDSLKGWHTPCHLKPARDNRTGKLKDVSGGWHQSGDTRKWLFGTTPGMFGLYALEKCRRKMPWAKDVIWEEMKWGNKYFHKIQRISTLG